MNCCCVEWLLSTGAQLVLSPFFIATHFSFWSSSSYLTMFSLLLVAYWEEIFLNFKFLPIFLSCPYFWLLIWLDKNFKLTFFCIFLFFCSFGKALNSLGILLPQPTSARITSMLYHVWQVDWEFEGIALYIYHLCKTRFKC